MQKSTLQYTLYNTILGIYVASIETLASCYHG